MTTLIDNKTLTIFVIAFAAFIVVGLAVTPILVDEADAVKKKKGPKKTDSILEQPVIRLI